MEGDLKIIRKDASGKVIEEINIKPKDIKDGKAVIGAPQGGAIHKLTIVEVPYEVKVAKFVEEIIKVDKIELVEKKRIIEVPIFINKDIVVTNVTVDEVKKKIIVYELEKVKVRVPVIEEYIVKVPRLVYVDTKVPKLIPVDTPFPRIVYTDVIIDNPILNERTIDTCVINHICPFCKKKAAFDPETNKE